MSDDNYYSPEQINARARDKTREDFGDQQNEMAGRVTFKAARFISEQERSRRAGKGNGPNGGTLKLHILMMKAVYRAAYRAAISALSGAENAVYDALLDASAQVQTAQRELDTALDAAASLEDGTRIFRRTDGGVYTEDGQKVDDALAATLQRHENATTWNDYLAKQKALHHVQNRHAKLSRYDAELTDIRNQMEDADNPPTTGELDNFNKRISEIETDLAKRNNATAAFEVETPDKNIALDLSSDLSSFSF